MILPNSPIKILGNSVKEFLSYDRTNKQTEITTLYIDYHDLVKYIFTLFEIFYMYYASIYILYNSEV